MPVNQGFFEIINHFRLKIWLLACYWEVSRQEPGGPVCRPCKRVRNWILHPVRATARVAPTPICLNPDGRVTDPPLQRIQKPSVFNVGAGPRPARRCTRRAEVVAQTSLSCPCGAIHPPPGRRNPPQIEKKFPRDPQPPGNLKTQRKLQSLSQSGICLACSYRRT